MDYVVIMIFYYISKPVTLLSQDCGVTCLDVYADCILYNFL